MTDDELRGLITGLVGRMAMLETLNTNMLTIMATQFDRPVEMVAGIMAATADDLTRHQPGVDQGVQRAAIESFDGLSKTMLALVNRLATPEGRA